MDNQITKSPRPKGERGTLTNISNNLIAFHKAS